MSAAESHEAPRPHGLFKSKLLWNKLMGFNRYSSVVILIPGVPNSIALLFTLRFPIPLRHHLLISRAEAKTMHKTLQSSVKTRGDDDQPSQSETEDPNGISEQLVLPEEPFKSNPRSLRRKTLRADASVDIVLKRL